MWTQYVMLTMLTAFRYTRSGLPRTAEGNLIAALIAAPRSRSLHVEGGYPQPPLNRRPVELNFNQPFWPSVAYRVQGQVKGRAGSRGPGRFGSGSGG